MLARCSCQLRWPSTYGDGELCTSNTLVWQIGQARWNVCAAAEPSGPAAAGAAASVAAAAARAAWARGLGWGKVEAVARAWKEWGAGCCGRGRAASTCGRHRRP
jgi:hypothetical protein